MRRIAIRTHSAGAGLLVALASIIPLSQSDAVTTTATFQVTANVAVSCTVSATVLDFGTYDRTATSPTTAQSNIQVNCTTGAIWELALDKGLHGADVTSRAMANDTDAAVLLNYAIFSDPAHTINWGETVGTNTVTGTGTGTVQDIAAYGQIPALQATVSAGGYSDTITATLSF
jgi:spore coat protein U-like protein